MIAYVLKISLLMNMDRRHELCRVRRIAGWQEPGGSQSFLSGSAEFEIESDSIATICGSAALARITIQSVAGTMMMSSSAMRMASIVGLGGT